VQESIHVSTTIDRSAADVYDYAADPANLSNWASGLAHQPVEHIDGQWVAESPMGRVVIELVPRNDYGVLDHDVTLPSGETVTNPMRVFPNEQGCDVVFTVHRRAGMDDAQFAADAEAVTKDLATLRTLLEA
jgi:hypothetical protein